LTLFFDYILTSAWFTVQARANKILQLYDGA